MAPPGAVGVRGRADLGAEHGRGRRAGRPRRAASTARARPTPPGDGLPLDAVQPELHAHRPAPGGFRAAGDRDGLAARRPAGRSPRRGGRGPDGSPARSYILDDVTGNDVAEPGHLQEGRDRAARADGHQDVDGKLYVSEKYRLTELTDTNGDGITDSASTVATWPFGGNFHEFAFGLLYEEDYFYVNLLRRHQPRRRDHRPAAGAEPRHAPEDRPGHRRGRRTSPAACARPNGIGWGPEGDIFVMDNQGGWLPASKLCTSSRTGSSTTTPTPTARSTTSR